MKKYFSFLSLLFLLISCQNRTLTNTKVTAKTTQIDSITQQDSLVIKEFLPYKSKMIEEVNKVLSYAPKNLIRTDGKLQSSLGNLLADLTFEKANELFQKETGKKVDFSMSNYGGIRAGIWKGDVKVMHAFNLMPFENTIVIVELTAEKLEELLEYFAVKNQAHPISKQLQIVANKGFYTLKINGKPIDYNRTYFVATSNYLQKGGDGMNFFAQPESLYESNFLIRDAIVEHFKSKDTLVSSLDKRVIIQE